MTPVEHDLEQPRGELHSDPAPVRHVRVAVIGAGFAGIGLAWNLGQAGISDFLILERAQSVGGVWRDNTYPGAACDVPSHLYSLSFAPNPNWERTFSHGAPIREYLERVAHEHGIVPFIRFGEELLDARWEDDAQRWRLVSTTLELTADVLVSCAGPLTEPVFPDVPGLERFTGKVFHSSRWDHEHDLTGRRVAVVGSGASAVQIAPAIQPLVDELVVFQRTPGWVIPRLDRDVTSFERRMLRRFPRLIRVLRGFQLAVRDGFHHRAIARRPIARRVAGAVARRHLRRQVSDLRLRRELTPDFEIGCKRILISNDWYPALAAPNTTLVPSAVSEVGESSVTDAAGRTREVDAIVFATGFEVAGAPVYARIHGHGGGSLADAWQGDPRFMRGVAISGFPNFFMLSGPGAGLGHGSMVWQMEAQMTYVLDALRVMRERDLTSVDVRPEVQDAYMASVDARLGEMVWVKGGCQSWYLDTSGVPRALWPGTMREFKRMLERFDVESYAVREAAAPARAVVAS